MHDLRAEQSEKRERTHAPTDSEVAVHWSQTKNVSEHSALSYSLCIRSLISILYFITAFRHKFWGNTNNNRTSLAYSTARKKKNAARFAQYTIRTYISIVCGCVRWSLISNSYIYSALVCQCVRACIISCRLRRIEWLLFIQTQLGLSSVCVSWRNRNKKYFFMYFYHNNVNSHNNVFWHSWVKKKKEVNFVLDVE